MRRKSLLKGIVCWTCFHFKKSFVCSIEILNNKLLDEVISVSPLVPHSLGDLLQVRRDEDETSLSAMVKAVLAEDIEQINIIKLTTEFSPNVADEFGNTLLHIAVLNNKSKSITYLLSEDGVSVNARNNGGQTPLFIACQTGKLEISKKLIEAGASVNIADYSKNTPLHECTGYPEIAHILIQNGANIYAVHCHESTPLHYAVRRHHLETVCLLLYYNCDTAVINWSGNTPFMYALLSENIEIQNMLFEYVDDFNTCSYDEVTILAQAIAHRSPFVEEMLSRGAKVNSQALENSLFNKNLFEIIWKRVEPNVELENSNLLNTLLCGQIDDYIFQYIDIILENSNDSVLEALANCVNLLQSEISHLINHCFCHRPEGLGYLTRLICVLLQFNCKFRPEIIYEVYKYFKYCDLFKYLLHMNDSIEHCNYFEIRENWIMPMYIYNINIDMKEICRNLKPCKSITDEYTLEALEYSVDFHLVQKLIYDKDLTKDYVDVRKKIPTVPSLLQLARDKFRSFIVNKYKFSRSSQFYTFINNLNIAPVHRQIITLEKKIYNFI